MSKNRNKNPNNNSGNKNNQNNNNRPTDNQQSHNKTAEKGSGNFECHAPYNFVPLSDRTFTSEEDKISLDIPFEDGIDGMFEVEIEAKTPITIRQGSAQKEKQAPDFCKTPDNKFFIPATSIKGAIKNIFEIITFSKMSQVGEDKYNVRISKDKKQAIKELNKFVPRSHQEDKLDMTEMLFGRVESKNGKQNNLKGRVQFSHAFVEGTATECPKIDVYQASPKPTYYPNYLQQDVDQNGKLKQGKYKTMLDKDALLRGWKRYPARVNKRDDLFTQTQSNQEDNKNAFKPLPQGTKFRFKVIVHNIRPFELGALIRSIELWENCFHSLGALKPFGYGRCKMSITNFEFYNSANNTIVRENQKNSYIQQFEKKIKSKITNYSECEQLKELKALLNPNCSNKKDLSYMNLKEHQKVKSAKITLPQYSKIKPQNGKK